MKLEHARQHTPRLVQSQHVVDSAAVRVTLALAGAAGSPRALLLVLAWLATMLLAGAVLAFDAPPWPLTLALASIPQLPLGMAILAQGNLAQRASDARAQADHASITAMHTLLVEVHQINVQQNTILERLTPRS